MGLTAGSGSDGAGDIDLRSEGDELNDDRRLGVRTGGFIGSGSDIGVPGAEGTGDAPVSDGASATWSWRGPKSGRAGLLDEILLEGRSILEIFPCGSSVNWPSLVLRL